MGAHYYRIENKDEWPDEPPLQAAGLNKYTEQHRRRIEPWLSSVFQSEHLSVLIGSGLSTALSQLVSVKPLTMAPADLSGDFAHELSDHAAETAKRTGRGAPNIEDQVRAIEALATGLEIQRDPRAPAMRQRLRDTLLGIARGIVDMEASVAAAISADDLKWALFSNTLTSFLLSAASRTPMRDRLSIFTTNYDRFLEFGFDVAGVRPMDRFVGQLYPVFRSSRLDVDLHYSSPGNRTEARPLEGVVRFGKLHGSIDWLYENKRVLRVPSRFGRHPIELTRDNADDLMVFPNAAKDFETAFYPYADIFRDFSASLCRPNSALLVYGYGFGDDHINRVIADMLSLPSTHLVAISYDDAGGRLKEFVERDGRLAQVSILQGPHFADLRTLTRHYLPKPAIDHISIRRTELVGRRDLPVRDVADESEEGGS